jgi:hypothetical protein
MAKKNMYRKNVSTLIIDWNIISKNVSTLILRWNIIFMCVAALFDLFEKKLKYAKYFFHVSTYSIFYLINKFLYSILLYVFFLLYEAIVLHSFKLLIFGKKQYMNMLAVYWDTV